MSLQMYAVYSGALLIKIDFSVQDRPETASPSFLLQTTANVGVLLVSTINCGKMLRNIVTRFPLAPQSVSKIVVGAKSTQNTGPKVWGNCVMAKSIPNTLSRPFSISTCLLRRSDRLGSKTVKLTGHGGETGTEGEHAVNLDHLHR